METMHELQSEASELPALRLEIWWVFPEGRLEKLELGEHHGCLEEGHRLICRIAPNARPLAFPGYPEARIGVTIQCENCDLQRVGHLPYRGADISRYHLPELMTVWFAESWHYNTYITDEKSQLVRCPLHPNVDESFAWLENWRIEG